MSSRRHFFPHVPPAGFAPCISFCRMKKAKKCQDGNILIPETSPWESTFCRNESHCSSPPGRAGTNGSAFLTHTHDHMHTGNFPEGGLRQCVSFARALPLATVRISWASFNHGLRKRWRSSRSSHAPLPFPENGKGRHGPEEPGEGSATGEGRKYMYQCR